MATSREGSVISGLSTLDANQILENPEDVLFGEALAERGSSSDTM